MDWTKLDAAVDALRQDFIADTRALVSIESVSAPDAGAGKPFGEGVRRALDKALSLGEGYGFRTLDLDGYCGEITLENAVGGDAAIGILCHLDTVPIGGGWTKNPLGGEVIGGRMFGRGTLDDKGPAVAALCAMRAVRAAGIPLKRDARLILGCDEETGSLRDIDYYKARRKPMYERGFSPDAAFPVIHIEKGRLRLKLSKAADGARGILPVLRVFAGERVNVVPDEARAVVALGDMSPDVLRERLRAIAEGHGFDLRLEAVEADRAEIRAVGTQAHASTPELGKNAAGMLLVALAELGAGGTYASAIARLADALGTEYDGKSLGIARADESGALTCNLGLLRCDARELSATLDIRYPVRADEADLLDRVGAALGDAGIALTRLSESCIPLHVPEDGDLVRGLLRVYGDVTGLPAYAYAIGGGTYAHYMPNTVAFGPIFPDETDTCHMPDESVSVDNMMTAAKIFAHAIVELAGDAR